MATAEYVLNGNFEAGTDNWKFLGDSFIDPSEGIDGTPCAGMKFSTGTEILQGEFAVIKGAYYDLTLYAKGVTDETFRMSVLGLSGSFFVSLISKVVGKEYSKYRFNFRCNDERILIKVLPVKGSSILYIDNVSLRGTVISFRGDTILKLQDVGSGTDVAIAAEKVEGGKYAVFSPTLGSYVTITNNIKTEPTGTVIPPPSYDPALQSSANCAEYVNYFLYLRDWKPIYPDYLYTFITDQSTDHDVDGNVCLTYGIVELKEYTSTHNVAFETL